LYQSGTEAEDGFGKKSSGIAPVVSVKIICAI
jgi:hypothetical protein